MKIKNFKSKISKGFSLAELVVMVFIATFSILIVWNIYSFFTQISLSNPSLFQASFLAEEGVEAVKFMRDSSWNTNIATLSTSTSYTLVFDGATWKASTTPTFIDGKFDRRVVVGDVSRNVNGDIDPAGSFDINTKKITVTVSWLKDNATTSREITTYVSNLFDN